MLIAQEVPEGRAPRSYAGADGDDWGPGDFPLDKPPYRVSFVHVHLWFVSMERSRVWRWLWPWGHGDREAENRKSTEDEAGS